MTETLELFFRNNALIASGVLLVAALVVVHVLRRSHQPSIPSLIIRLMYRWCRWCLVVTECTDLFLKIYRDRMSRALSSPINESGIVPVPHRTAISQLDLVRDQT